MFTGWLDRRMDAWYLLSLFPLGVWMLNCLGGQSQLPPPSKMIAFSQRRCQNLLLPVYSQEKSGAAAGSRKPLIVSAGCVCVTQTAGPPGRHILSSWTASP